MFPSKKKRCKANGIGGLLRMTWLLRKPRSKAQPEQVVVCTNWLSKLSTNLATSMPPPRLQVYSTAATHGGDDDISDPEDATAQQVFNERGRMPSQLPVF